MVMIVIQKTLENTLDPITQCSHLCPPEEGSKPHWAQLYIYDTEHEIENRINASKCYGEKSSVDPNLIVGLQKMLDENNILAKTFRMASDRFKQEDYHDFTLKLIGKCNRSGTHGLPSASEVAALIVRSR
jgi:hypothetical protein